MTQPPRFTHDSSRFKQRQMHLFSPTKMMTAATLLVHLHAALQSMQTALADDYYQRYPVYHPYCSDPKEMATRSIPPLSDDDLFHFRNLPDEANVTAADSTDQETINNATVSRLVHVTAVIRHGARTITRPKPCWDGYWDGPEGIWDCNFKTVLATRPYRYPDDTSGTENDGFYFLEKVYDAFQGEGVDSPYKNNLNGTCQAGQLIEPGYDQQQLNGQYFRAAYVHDGSGDNTQQEDPRMRLFDTSSATSEDMPFAPQHLRYRSDDDQRTLVSGQIFLSRMFQPEFDRYRSATGTIPFVPHHTADRPMDIMSPHYECSSPQQAEHESLASQEYQTFFHSQESQTIRAMLREEMGLGDSTTYELLDCLMTAMCTDRTLPPVLNDYGQEPREDDAFTDRYGPHRFERLVNYLIQNQTITQRHNDARWSKLVMGPLWAEILDHIQPVVQSSQQQQQQSAVKFALYSGHDSTIAPLMASLSPKLWNQTDFPWYASMMIIEVSRGQESGMSCEKVWFEISHFVFFSHLLQIHEILSISGGDVNDYAFRLVYNGQVLTWLVDGCPEYSHLCHVSILLDRISQFATRENGGCGVGEISMGGPASRLSHLLWRVQVADSEHPEMFLMAAMMTSFVVGSLLTCCVAKCCWSRPRRRQRNQSELVLGNEETSCDFMMEEPEVVID
jgi:hypothetical protein